MRWSKLKKLVEERFSPNIKNRVSIYSTVYGNCSCGHAWLTLDKNVVANFCTRAFYNRAMQERGSIRYENSRWVGDAAIPEYVKDSQNIKYGEMEYGELSRQNAYQSCWEFVHELSICDALGSKDPLIQTLSVLDSRIGKRRLKSLETENFHPLAEKMLKIRQQVEGAINVTL